MKAARSVLTTMRLGTIILVLGIVVIFASAGMTTTERYQTGCSFDRFGNQNCDYETVQVPNSNQPAVQALGGLMIVVGAGGWVGAYSADKRRRNEQ